MEILIKDATGKGYSAGVNEDNRLQTSSVSTKEMAYESFRHGDAFVLNTGFISLTQTAAFNGVLYFKNTSTQELYIEKIRVCGGLCAGASTMQVIFVANPTDGTLISDAVAGLSISANLSSSNSFTGLVYTGGDNKTVTGGQQLSNFQGHAPGHSVQEYEGLIILGRNDSIAVTLKPSVAMSVCMEVICYYK